MSVVIVGATTAVGAVIAPYLHTANIDMLYLLAVLISALEWGHGPGIFAAVASAVVFDYGFIPPRFSFHTSDLPYLVTLVGFVLVALATSTLAARARELTTVQKARARAEAQSQAKDELLNKISHELRAPVNAVLGWAHLSARAIDDRTRLIRAISGLQHSAEMVAQLTEDLLSASRIASGKFPVDLRPTALTPIVAKAVEVMTPTSLDRQVRLEATLDPAVGDIMGDASRLEQVIVNLVSNAVKFTPPEGRVVVRLGRAGTDAQIEISDTGEGIPADFLPHVFDAFSQADGKNARGGLGLGLAITKYLVGAHSGRIEVRSPGTDGGTTVLVRLPLLTTSELAGHAAAELPSAGDVEMEGT